MKIQKSILFSINLLYSVLVSANATAEANAFPSAYGAGAEATGGRGGKVIHVTNLNEDGPGSLREALFAEPSTPRTIVFDVSGTIKMQNPLYSSSSLKNFTIAGQTAPRGGITIESPGAGFFKSENAIIRYLRFVNNSYFVDQSNTATFTISGSNNVIVDHCSMRYAWIAMGFAAQDDNDTNNGQGDITLQRSIIADNHTGALFGATVDEPRASLAGTNSILQNLFAHVSHRFPNVSGHAKSEVVQNVVYNYRGRLNTFFNDSENNLINNTFKAGPTSVFNAARNKIGEYIGGTPRVYTRGNQIIDENNPAFTHASTDSDWNGLFVIWVTPSDNTEEEVSPQKETLYRQGTPFPGLGVPFPLMNTNAAFNDVLNDVGTNAYLQANGAVGRYLDENDANYINDVIAGTCWSCMPDGSHPDKTVAENLNYPNLPSNTRPSNYDTDNDGMPNIWEQAMGFNPGVPDQNGDHDNDGYTNLEEFLNLVDGTPDTPDSPEQEPDILDFLPAIMAGSRDSS